MKIVGQKLEISELEVNDLFYMNFGGDPCKFRVNVRLQDDLLVHSTTWCKSDQMSLKKYQDRPLYYAGKMSKLKAFFIL